MGEEGHMLFICVHASVKADDIKLCPVHLSRIEELAMHACHPE